MCVRVGHGHRCACLWRRCGGLLLLGGSLSWPSLPLSIFESINGLPLSLSRLTRTNRITELLRLREIIALDKDRTHACFFLPLRWRALESQAAVLLCEAAAGKREDFTQIGAKWVHPHFPPALPCAVLWRAGRAGWHGGWPQHYRAWTATAGRTVRGTRYCRYSTYPP